MKSFRPCCLATIVGLSVFILLTAVVWQVVQGRRAELLAGHRLTATINLHEKHDHVDQLLREFLSIVKSLGAFAQLAPTFESQDFEIFTAALDLPRSVRTVQLQPDGVIRHLTDRAGNPDALGLDLLSHPTLGPMAWETIRSRQPKLVGPIDLVQGGQGFVLRQAVFIDGYESAVGVPGFWGFAAAVFDAETVFGEVGLDGVTEPDAPGVYALRRVGKDSRPGPVIYGDARTFDDAVQTAIISLPHIELELAVALKPEFTAKGFPLVPEDVRPIFYLLMGLASVISAGLWLAIRHQQRHQALATEYASAQAASRLKTDFITTMSHEMRTPLNGVLGTMELLERTALSDEQRHLLRIGQSSGQLLLQHVNSVLDIERLQHGLVETASSQIDVNDLLSEVADLISPAAGLNQTVVHCETVLSGRHLVGDTAKLRQVLLNFAGNAAKFTKAGRILLSARTISSKTLTETVEFRVSDTGIGITAENLKHVFDDFVTVDASYDREVTGSGLGLAICRRIADVLGGEVGAESEPGRGSSFWLRVPLQIAQAGATDIGDAREEAGAEADPLAELDPRASLDILLVDDNATNRIVGGGLLSAAGHRITEASDGREALEVAKTRRFDLILMDISMPHVDGVQATRMIREMAGPNRDTPIVALTAHAMPAERRRFMDAGMQACMIKPFRVREFEDLLGTAKAGPHAAGQPVAADAENGEQDDIDWTVLKGLEETLGPELLTTTMAEAVSEIEEEVASLLDPDGSPPRDLVFRAHKLAGTTAIIGAARLTNSLRLVETAAKHQNQDSLEAALKAVREAIKPACRKIEERYGLRSLQQAGGN